MAEADRAAGGSRDDPPDRNGADVSVLAAELDEAFERLDESFLDELQERALARASRLQRRDS